MKRQIPQWWRISSALQSYFGNPIKIFSCFFLLIFYLQNIFCDIRFSDFYSQIGSFQFYNNSFTQMKNNFSPTPFYYWKNMMIAFLINWTRRVMNNGSRLCVIQLSKFFCSSLPTIDVSHISIQLTYLLIVPWGIQKIIISFESIPSIMLQNLNGKTWYLLWPSFFKSIFCAKKTFSSKSGNSKRIINLFRIIIILFKRPFKKKREKKLQK